MTTTRKPVTKKNNPQAQSASSKTKQPSIKSKLVKGVAKGVAKEVAKGITKRAAESVLGILGNKQNNASANNNNKAASKPEGSTDSKLLAALKEYVRANAERLMLHENITSVGIGYKQKDGVETSQISIQFTVENKMTPQSLGEKAIPALPQTIKVGSYLVPTDVLERKFKPSYIVHNLRAKDSRRARIDPVQPGTSIAEEKLTAGTLGAFVKDKKTGLPVMLSNWHVLVGAKGDVGSRITQPGRYDDSQTGKNVVGKVLRHFLGVAGDCAIASFSGRSFSNVPLGLNGVSVDSIGSPELNDRVVKSGRTTGVTYGIVTRIEVNTKISYGDGITATVGGFEIGRDSSKPSKNGEISMGGDSGSVWLAVKQDGQPSGTMLGLHFAGQDGAVNEVALACYAKSVMDKLEIEPLGQFTGQALSPTSSYLQTGFDRDFISFPVEIKSFNDHVSKDLATLDDDPELRYCHFSAWLSMERKYPVCVAWNIDGSRYTKTNRMNFRTDRRGDLEGYQLTQKFYVDNPLDKGHIARRADLSWGSLEEARQANYDSFYYTNITPQHESFNQSKNYAYDSEGGLWGRLENTVFDSEQPHDLRVSLIAGPVFGKKDRIFEQNRESAKLPCEFWKIVAYKDDEDDKEKVFAFLLTQAKMIQDFLGPQSLNLDEWLWARIDLFDLQKKIGIQFPSSMHNREVKLTVPQVLGNAPRLKICRSADDFFAD